MNGTFVVTAFAEDKQEKKLLSLIPLLLFESLTRGSILV